MAPSSPFALLAKYATSSKRILSKDFAQLNQFWKVSKCPHAHCFHFSFSEFIYKQFLLAIANFLAHIYHLYHLPYTILLHLYLLNANYFIHYQMINCEKCYWKNGVICRREYVWTKKGLLVILTTLIIYHWCNRWHRPWRMSRHISFNFMKHFHWNAYTKIGRFAFGEAL